MSIKLHQIVHTHRYQAPNLSYVCHMQMAVNRDEPKCCLYVKHLQKLSWVGFCVDNHSMVWTRRTVNSLEWTEDRVLAFVSAIYNGSPKILAITPKFNSSSYNSQWAQRTSIPSICLIFNFFSCNFKERDQRYSWIYPLVQMHAEIQWIISWLMSHHSNFHGNQFSSFYVPLLTNKQTTDRG